MADFNSNRFQSKRQTYETPEDLFRPLADEFRFTLDVAADAANAKCAEFFDEAADGLAQDWRGVCWCNPPYREQSKWVKKAFAEARAGRATTVLLVPARTNTGWWHDYCMKGEVRFVRGRPRFAGCKHGLPQPLALVIFRTSKTRLTVRADRKGKNMKDDSKPTPDTGEGTCSAEFMVRRRPRTSRICGQPATVLWVPRSHPENAQKMCLSCAKLHAGNFSERKPESKTFKKSQA